MRQYCTHRMRGSCRDAAARQYCGRHERGTGCAYGVAHTVQCSRVDIPRGLCVSHGSLLNTKPVQERCQCG